MIIMSQLDLSGFRKRKRGERVFKFTTFGERGYPAEFTGSFHENVRALLEYGQVETGACGTMASWSFQLEVRRHPLLHVFLFVVEEPIELSLELHCRHCQYIGWGHHMICNKKYHFLLPSNSGPGENGKSDWNIELHGDEGHKMHGVFHSNGFGHLLCINGSENGSDLLGYQIMEFWDRLCSKLGARKVSLKDVAKKKGMDFRLLHAVAYGKPWFGRWDYTFGRGSFGVNQETYQAAVKAIRGIPLNLLTHHDQVFELTDHETQIILARYQVLSCHPLMTLGDLFRFMFDQKYRLAKENSLYAGIMSDTSCRWSPKRVEMAIHVVVEALKRSESRWVSRQHVRDIARAYIGDTGLLDFVLKSLGNHIVGNYFVRRCLNPVTKVLEYCLEDVSPKPKSLINQNNLSWAQLTRDIFYMNKNILTRDQTNTTISNNGSHALATIAVASRIILDTKYLVKEYWGDEAVQDDDQITNKLKIYCAVMLANDSESRSDSMTISTPYHCFKLKRNATFSELKFEVEKTFREIYWGLRDFTPISTHSINSDGSDLVFKTAKPDSKISFECNMTSDHGLLMGVVDCICGTKDDDGERLVCCDICQVWQHTRCVQIPDSDEVPTIFLCNTCEQDIMLRFPHLP